MPKKFHPKIKFLCGFSSSPLPILTRPLSTPYAACSTKHAGNRYRSHGKLIRADPISRAKRPTGGCGGNPSGKVVIPDGIGVRAPCCMVCGVNDNAECAEGERKKREGSGIGTSASMNILQTSHYRVHRTL